MINLTDMQKALTLVRTGRLGEATSLIQRSLVDKTTTKRGELSYRFFIPARLNHSTPAPLLIMLHGCKQNASDFAVGTQMDSIAEQAGCFVLYPQQSTVANPWRCWNWFKHTHQSRDRGEPKLIADLIANLIATHDIDASRVYVAGLSAGGAMAAIMAEQYSEMFTALGVHSGLPTGVARNLPEAMNLMRGVTSQCSEFLRRYVDKLNTHIETLQGIEGRPFTRKIYRTKNGDLIGEYWAIKGAGHAWSGGSRSGSYTDSYGPNASA